MTNKEKMKDRYGSENEELFLFACKELNACPDWTLNPCRGGGKSTLMLIDLFMNVVINKTRRVVYRDFNTIQPESFMLFQDHNYEYSRTQIKLLDKMLKAYGLRCTLYRDCLEINHEPIGYNIKLSVVADDGTIIDEGYIYEKATKIDFENISELINVYSAGTTQLSYNEYRKGKKDDR